MTKSKNLPPVWSQLLWPVSLMYQFPVVSRQLGKLLCCWWLLCRLYDPIGSKQVKLVNAIKIHKNKTVVMVLSADMLHLHRCYNNECITVAHHCPWGKQHGLPPVLLIKASAHFALKATAETSTNGCSIRLLDVSDYWWIAGKKKSLSSSVPATKCSAIRQRGQIEQPNYKPPVKPVEPDERRARGLGVVSHLGCLTLSLEPYGGCFKFGKMFLYVMPAQSMVENYKAT